MYDFQEEDQEYETYDQQSDTSSVLGDDNNLISNDSKEFEHSSTTTEEENYDEEENYENENYEHDNYSHHYLIDSSSEGEYESDSNDESDMDLIRSQTIVEPEWNVQSVTSIPSPIPSPRLSPTLLSSPSSPTLSISPPCPSPSPPSPIITPPSIPISPALSNSSNTSKSSYSSNSTIDTLTEQVNYQRLEFHSQVEELTDKCQSLQTQIILLHTQLEEEKKDKKDALTLRNDAIEARDYILDRCERNIHQNDVQHDKELHEIKKQLEEMTEERDDMTDERDQALDHVEEWKKENDELTQKNEVCRNAYRKILQERVHDFSRLAGYTSLRYNVDKY